MSEHSSAACRGVVFTDDFGWHGRRLADAFAALGVDLVAATLSDCRLRIAGAAESSIEVPGFAGGMPAFAFVRGIAGGTLEEITFRLDILHALEHVGVPVINGPRAIERTVDKAMTSFLLSHAGLPTPPTWVGTAVGSASGPLVAKPLFGSQGNGVRRIDAARFVDGGDNSGVFYLQRFIERDGPPYADWRLFVIGGTVTGAMLRQSQDWVTNRALGAECLAATPEAELVDIAERAATVLGLDYGGVDIVRGRDGRPWIIEVNSMPAWQGLQRICDTDIAAALAARTMTRTAAARRQAIIGV
ncbi:MAG: ATP-grasp domain-containing protein [Gammaproteobacteria bacterium]|nr:ATP-grasp domain-containing protein [Gammaproteobacteria bacterium]